MPLSGVTCPDDLCDGFLDNANTLVVVTPPTLDLKIGDTKELQAVIKVGDEQCEGEIEWSSIPKGVVTVDKEGNVEAIEEGTTTVFAAVKGAPHIIIS